MNKRELQARTKTFAIRIIRLVRALPSTSDGRAIGGQVVRSGTAVGANYRSACRSRSRKEFIARLGIAVEECDETAYWLELVVEAELLKDKQVMPLLTEANVLTAILVASRITAQRHEQ